jgi:trk system potassium uptake protein
MRVIIIGCGRVGSAIALDLVSRGRDVVVLDQDPDSLLRLGGDDFAGDFLVGEALDSELLERAGIEQADAFIASTDDDNVNIVIAQIAQRRYRVKTVVVRLFDPDKADFYSRRGMQVVCPTVRAIHEMVGAVEAGVRDADDETPAEA